MKKKKLIRIAIILTAAGVLIGGAVGLYMYNKPHRDVQSLRSDFSLTGTQLVTEYMEDRLAADNKYLVADGNSKILEVTGMVSKISENYNNLKVVLLKSEGDAAGVSAGFKTETNHNAENLEIGETITVKGVIRSGASYDEDLGFYENVILEKCDIVIQ